ncbi:OB-fold domain-containing protein [Halobacteriales archaeon Cl-PHB]
MTDVGIDAVGTYAPRLRVSADAIEAGLGRFNARGVQAKAVPDVDEDSVTMAYEAATRALAADGTDAGAVDALAFATTTPPMAEEDQAVRLGEILGVDSTASHHQFTGSTRAGTRAMLAMADAVRDDGTALVVASDCPRGQPDTSEGHAAGGGAAAFVLRADGAATFADRASYAEEYTGSRFRRRGADAIEGLDVTAYDRTAFVETATAAVDGLGGTPTDAEAVVVQAPDGDLPYRVLGGLGVEADRASDYLPVHALGDTGAASVPLGLASALDDGVESVLAVSQGSGAGADAIVVERDGAVPVTRAEDAEIDLDYADYVKRTGDVTRDEPGGGGAYVSVPTWRRTLDQRYRLEGGRCPECGAVTLVPDGACPGCHELVDYEPVQLAETATVRTVTTISQGGAPPEFVAQQARAGDFAVVIVAFDGPEGGSAPVPAQVVDAPPEDVAVGDRVEATIRRIYEQEGVVRYGFKVRPVDA